MALVCGFKYLASEKSREPVGGDAAQALATCPDSAVAIRIGTTEMDNAIAIDNDSLRMGEATRTLTGDHESRVTDTGTSIVQPVVAIDGNKLCKNERAGGSGLGVSTEGVMYTETACDNHAIAVRTANTHANGHGVAEEATHTLDRASGQAVAVGIDPYNAAQTGPAAATLGVNAGMPTGRNAVAVGFKAGQSANGGLGIEEEVCPTQSHQPSALEPTVAVGCDRRNQSGADEVQPALQSTVSDGGSTVALNHIVRRLTPTEAERLQGFPDNWTRIPYRGRPAEQCPDSPRYKALGNSFATNCCEYVLRRIVAAFQLDMI